MKETKYLMTPGPTNIPPRALLAMSRPIIHHRTEEFSRIFSEVNEGLKYVFQTENDVLTLTASSTGAMEAAVVNVLSAGDEVLAVVSGKFSERFADIAEAFATKVDRLEVQWGRAVAPKEIEARLKDKNYKAVMLVHNETSTGVLNDLKSIAQITSGYPALLMVDVITSLGAIELRTDEWGIDVAVGGSQKGLMIPPGLAFITLSDKAWEALEESNLPRYYWDLKAARKSLAKMQTPWTPAISLIVALREVLDMIKEEGIENVWQRHKDMAQATRVGVKAIGLEPLVPDEEASYSVTAVKIPEGVKDTALRNTMRDRYGVVIAGGQEELKGKIIRIGHMGFVDRLEAIATLCALEMSLIENGFSVELGEAVRAAEEYLPK